MTQAVAQTNRGEHYSRALSNGLEIHLIRYPGSDKWRIKSFDTTWGSIKHGLTTKTWFAEPLGLAKLDFESTDAACAYLEKHAKLVPSQTATGP